MPILTKLFSAILLFGLSFALPPAIYADSFVVTSGYTFGDGVSTAYFHLSGTDFHITGVDIDGGSIVWGCGPCASGDVSPLNAYIAPNNGSATINVNGVAYRGVPISGQLNFTVNNTRPVPLLFTDFTITAPFTFAGSFAGYSDSERNHTIFTVSLHGQGLALARYRFHYLINGRPIFERVNVTYNFQDATANPLDNSYNFVQQQYFDFLNREPDDGGLSYWISQIEQCGADAACVNRKRVDVSAAFFVEPEFQQTGNFIYRIYKAAFGRQPSLAEFQADRSKFVASPHLETSQQAFADEFIRHAAFQSLYPDSLSNEQFVNKLFDTANLRPYVAERQARIVALYSRTQTRAQVLRDVTEFEEFKAREYNPSFVLMEYFGYLRRDPDEAGYDFWLNVLNSQPNNYKGMVCAFITSEEYQKRFSPLVTHSNAECGP